jgi:hypothetical protein
VWIVRETGKPIAQVARGQLGINEGTLGNWCARERARGAENGPLSEDERAELERLRRENAGGCSRRARSGAGGAGQDAAQGSGGEGQAFASSEVVVLGGHEVIDAARDTVISRRRIGLESWVGGGAGGPGESLLRGRTRGGEFSNC